MTDIPSTPMTDQLAWVRGQEERTHKNRRVTNVLVTLFCLATLVDVTFSHVSLGNRIDKVLGIAQKATGPRSQHAAQAFQNQIILCDENHTDRVVALILQTPVPPLVAGCPVDSIKK